jgi:hypothetical protein
VEEKEEPRAEEEEAVTPLQLPLHHKIQYFHNEYNN